MGKIAGTYIYERKQEVSCQVISVVMNIVRRMYTAPFSAIVSYKHIK